MWSKNSNSFVSKWRLQVPYQPLKRKAVGYKYVPAPGGGESPNKKRRLPLSEALREGETAMECGYCLTVVTTRLQANQR